jgi:predicted ribonuclease YlaK
MVREKLRRLRHREWAYDFALDPQDVIGLSRLNMEQGLIGRVIVDAVMCNHGQLFMLQGSAGTGKTFTVNGIVSELRRLGASV